MRLIVILMIMLTSVGVGVNAAEDFTMEPKQYNFTPPNLNQTNPRVDQYCIDQLNSELGLNSKLLIQQYCKEVNNKVIFVLFIIFAMWLLEPVVYREMIKAKGIWRYDADRVMNFYKWVGLGLLFMATYAMLRL